MVDWLNLAVILIEAKPNLYKLKREMEEDKCLM
jgi:hypothetical protein